MVGGQKNPNKNVLSTHDINVEHEAVETPEKELLPIEYELITGQNVTANRNPGSRKNDLRNVLHQKAN